MTIRELIEDLQRLNPDREVCLEEQLSTDEFLGHVKPRALSITFMRIDVDTTQCAEGAEPRYVISFET